LVLPAGGNASVYTGSGNDTVSVDTVSVYNRLTIDTGAGDDNVSITKSATDELFALLGADDDTLSLTTVSARRSALDGGDGTNSLYLAGDLALAVYQDATRFQHVHFPWQA
jgi:hypothetical protein